MEISKDLLIKVLNNNKTKINIYELLDKCQDWAIGIEIFDKEYYKGQYNGDGLCNSKITNFIIERKDLELEKFNRNFHSKKYEVTIIYTSFSGSYGNSRIFRADDKKEAVIKACIWVFDNILIKDG